MHAPRPMASASPACFKSSTNTKRTFMIWVANNVNTAIFTGVFTFWRE